MATIHKNPRIDGRLLLLNRNEARHAAIEKEQLDALRRLIHAGKEKAK